MNKMNNKNLTIKETFDSAVQNHQKNFFKIAENLYKEILKINPNHFGSIFYLGTLLVQTQRFELAKSLLYKATQINPNYAAAHNNLGATLKELGEYQNAINCCQKAIQINPNYADAHNNLGAALKELREYQNAINCYKKAIQIQPNLESAHFNLGLVFKELGEFTKAISYFKKAIQIHPSYIIAHQNLMEAYEKTNQERELKSAISNAQTLIKGNPIIKLYEGILLSRNEKFVEAKNYLESILFDTKEIKNEILRVSTLAKCYDRIGNTDKAFNYFTKANNLFPQIRKVKYFDKNKYLQEIKIRKEFFKKSNIKKWPVLKQPDNEPSPIFLIGFPRSGTTLLDTILRSHPLIEVVEEKLMVEQLINSLNQSSDGKLESIKEIENEQIIKIRKTYFESLESQIQNKNNTKLYIDKLPLNIIHVGEIIRIFPNAKFIVSLRHPCDCVLSCFMQDFELNDAMANFLNLDDSAHLYDAVMNLWTQYTSIFSINYHEVKYENLIENFEPTVRSILNFLELSWDDSVLNYLITAKKRDRIATPSYYQVTKPIYSYAIGRWQRYKKQTSNIYPILEEWIKKFNY